MNIKHFRFLISLKNQLLIYFVLVALIVAMIFGAYYYLTFKDILFENIGNSQYKVVVEFMNNIDNRMKQIDNIISWICVNQNLTDILKREPSEIYIFDKVKQQAITDVKERFSFSEAYNNISAYYVLGSNGFEVRGGDNAYLVEPGLFRNSSWYIKGARMNGGISWGHMIRNYTGIYFGKEYKHIIPYYKEIIDIGRRKTIASIIIFFGPDIFFSVDAEKTVTDESAGEAMYLVDGEGTIILCSNMEMCGKSINGKGYFGALQNSGGGFFRSDADNKLVVYKKSNYSNWYLIKEMSPNLIAKQNTRIGATVLLIAVVTISFASLLSLFLTGNFVKPIKRLVRQVNEIACGNFDQNFKKGRMNLIELNELSRDIENMAHNIRELIARNLQEEEEKKRLELKMLQNQINPHFLYNTLSSVSWMASIQRSFGIKETIDSLMELLNFSTSNTNDKATIREELNALENYMNIQRIRYKGKVSFSIKCADKEIPYCSIPKFILQPIVENSVFHGIEPKNGTGEISVMLSRRQNDIIIEIFDDGVGIAEDKLKPILEGRTEHAGESRFGGVGLENVNRRIKLICGAEYGISIESREGEYTKVIVKLPLQNHDLRGEATRQ